MNLRKMIEFLDCFPKITISKPQTAVETVSNIIIMHSIFHFCKGIPYVRTPLYYQHLTEQDVLALIPNLLAPHQYMMLSSSQIAECYKRIRNHPALQIELDEMFWEQQHLLNLRNGVYDIHSQKVRMHSEEDCFDYVLDFEYRSGCKLADAPTFQHFVRTSIGDENLKCLLRIIGYCISSLTKGRKAFLLTGHGKTGKSTLLDLLEAVLTKELVSHEPFRTMASEQSKAKYIGKRINISRDNSSVPMRYEDSFKSLVSCEMTTGRELYKNSVDFHPTLKFIFASNLDLVFAHPDDAVYDRLVVLPFSRIIPEEMRDTELDQKLLSEKNVIFSLAVDTLKDLVESKYDFCMSKEGKEYLNHRRMLLHTAEIFLKEKTVLDPHGTISSVTLYDAYKDWCSSNGLPPIGRNEFYHKVRNYSSDIQYKKVDSESGRVNGFHGLRLHDST